jgi:hypothetical protein
VVVYALTLHDSRAREDYCLVRIAVVKERHLRELSETTINSNVLLEEHI